MAGGNVMRNSSKPEYTSLLVRYLNLYDIQRSFSIYEYKRRNTLICNDDIGKIKKNKEPYLKYLQTKLENT
jgi:hypothetical protein